MPSILSHGRRLESLFELVGSDENAMTAALGWCMAHVPGLVGQLAQEIGCAVPGERTEISLQTHKAGKGITDIEVSDPGVAAWIIEAKAGYEPPGVEQLSKYASRLADHPDTASDKVLIVLARSDRKELWLKLHVPEDVSGIPVKVVSWGQVQACSRRAYATTDNTGKALLRHLDGFLNKVLGMQVVNSNEAYVVSLSRSTFGGGSTTFIEVVEKYRKYFHPVGPGWPASPPNYVAFRWDARLQSIHHVDDYEVITNFDPHFPGTTEGAMNPLFLYHLGPPITPAHTVATGDIYPSGRVWAHIDLLLTCTSIYEARNKTQEREAAARKAG